LLQLDQGEIALRIHGEEIDEAGPAGAQMRIQDPESLLDNPGILQEQSLGNLGISGRASDDTDDQPLRARGEERVGRLPVADNARFAQDS
jgi:hypothetical protein